MSGDLILPNGGQPKRIILPGGEVANGSKPKDERTDAEKDKEINKGFPMAPTLVLMTEGAVRPAFLHGDGRACIMITIQGTDAKVADGEKALERAITAIMRYDAAMEMSTLIKRHAMSIPVQVR